MKILRALVSNPTIFEEPQPNAKPPFWIRTVLVMTCTGVSFSHGSNDGQKGVGLVMLILIAIVPTHFAVNHALAPRDIIVHVQQIEKVLARADSTKCSPKQKESIQKIKSELKDLNNQMEGKSAFSEIPSEKHILLRKDVLLITNQLGKLSKSQDCPLDAKDVSLLKGELSPLLALKKYTDFAPYWVIILISLCLGMGTMIGWERIVKTIGEKIGKTHLTYSQGASAELIAAGTIGLSSGLGLPVSTTHILSSGIAGSMVAKDGVKNLQRKTLTNILLAWVLTLPVCIGMSALFFWTFRMIL